MKTLKLTVAVLLASAVSAFGQTDSNPQMKTVFGDPEVSSIGGFGAIGFGYTEVGSQDAIYFSAQGAAIVNHNMAIGGGGKAFISRVAYDQNLNDDFNYVGGYAGLIVQPIVGWNQPVHVSFPVLIGGGGIGYIKHWGEYEDDDYEFDDEDSYAFFVVEPGLEVEFNMVKWMRLAATVSYRYTTDIKLRYRPLEGQNPSQTAYIAPNDMLRGINVGLVFKFGRF